MDNLTQIAITDNDEGIKQEHLPKVFDMFYRGNPKSQGAGMGLYIAKGIIEQLGGQILLESKENVGTKVLLTVPNNLEQA